MAGISRHSLLGLILAAFLALGACAAPAPIATPTQPPAAAPSPTKAPTATPTKRPLTRATIAMASAVSLGLLVPYLAKAKGYWNEEGLDVEWVIAGGGAKALAAVVGGSADFSFTGFAPEVIRLIDTGQKVKAIAVTLQGNHYILVLNKKIAEERRVSQKSPLVDKVRALKGLTVAVFSAGGSSFHLLRMIAAEANMDTEQDLTVTFIGNEAGMIAALRQGQIDAFMHVPPAVIESVVAGDADILINAPAGDVPMMAKQAQNGLTAQEGTISGRPELVDGALRALWRTERFFNQDVAAAAKALRTLDSYADIEERAFNTSIEVMQPLVPREPIITTEQFDDMVSWYNFAAKAEERTKITMDQFFDRGPAERAKKQLGF